jgi:O-antigen ligase
VANLAAEVVHRGSARRLIAGLVIVAISIAVGLAVGRLPEAPAWLWLLAGPGLLLLIIVLTRSARVCLALLLLVDVLGLYLDSFSIGPVALRTIDIFWFGLVLWVLVIRAADGPASSRRIGQPQLAWWLAALGVSLFPIAVQSLGDVTDPLVAWLRLVQTFSLVWLVPYAARDNDDSEFVLGAVEFAIFAEIARAIGDALLHGNVVERLQGANGPNTTGLLSAILIAAAVHAPVPRRFPVRAAIFVVGVTGLLMSRSLGATAAIAAALGIFGLRRVVTERASTRNALLAPVRIVLLVVAAVAIGASFRPDNLPTSAAFNQSTTVHRAVLATAGFELFADHPIVGVGWSRAPEVIGAPELNAQLRRRFGSGINPEFLPEKNPTGVHNAYVEILAEAGLLGIATFLLLLIASTRGIRNTLRSVRQDPRTYAIARCSLVLLVVILVWWNDNALYGAQPETVLAATFLGLIAATPAVLRNPEDVDGAVAPTRKRASY